MKWFIRTPSCRVSDAGYTIAVTARVPRANGGTSHFTYTLRDPDGADITSAPRLTMVMERAREHAREHRALEPACGEATR